MPQLTVRTNEADFSLIDEGQGEVIVLLHGFPLNKSMWAAQVSALSTTHRVVAPDLRGHGDSTVTEGTVTMRQMADDVAGLLDALEIRQPVTLCGLSMGGYVAWEFWRNYAARLARLILCDTRATADTEEVARARQMMAVQVVDTGAQLAADAMMPKLFAARTVDEQPKMVEAVRRTILSTHPLGIAATQRGMAERSDMTSQLAEIDTPTLVLCGEQDMISPPEEMRAIAQAMPNAGFVQIANAGHLAPLEQPGAANDSIHAFLANS